MKRGLCSRADLLLVLKSDRSEAANFTASHLGFERKVEQSVGEDKAESDISLPQKTEISPPPSPTLQQMPDAPFWRVEVCELYDIDDVVSTKFGQIQAQRPWKLTIEQSHAELVRWRFIEPRLRRELTHTLPVKQIDIRQVLARLCRAEVMQTLPRQLGCGWGRELQVIVDRSMAMTPYGPDQVSFCANLERLFPKQAMTYVDYRQGSERPIMSGQKGSARRYRLPPPGTLVIALTDLGLFSVKTEQAIWQQLGQQLQQNQCHALALIPTNVNSIDTVLQRYWRIIPWEQGRTVVDQDQAKLVDRLLVLISPATRIEPGFLRQVRQLIDVDASIEAALWQHPALISRSSVAATLDPKIANELRARFTGEDETIRTEVLKLLRRWRTHLPKEIWHEEIISLDETSQALLPRPEEVQQAYETFSHFGQRLFDGEQVGGLSRWFRGVEQRLPLRIWYDKAIKPALQLMWQSTHHGEPDAVPPPDYKPRLSDPEINNPIRTFQLYQKGATLQLLEANPPTGLLTESHRGSWLGQIKSRNGEIAIVPQESFWQSGQPPTWASDWGEDEYGRWAEFSLEPLTQRLRWIPSGSFTMGSPESEAERRENEGSQHQVTLTQGYWLFDTAVSQALWQVVTEDNPSYSQGEDKPVENVSWDDCQVFIDKLNVLVPGLSLCLPSEAQWEYACRAGSLTAYSFGEQFFPKLANNESETVAVKSFQPNAWGLYQMHGNVDEWCLDGRRDYSAENVSDPLGSMETGTSRVVRGGSWYNFARSLRAAGRDASVPDYRYGDIGLRCARVQVGAEPVESWQHRSGTRRAATDRAGGARRVVLTSGMNAGQLPWFDEVDFVIRSDLAELVLRQLHCPLWANTIGRDCFGLWTEIELEGEQGKVRQRLRWILPGRFMMGSPKSEYGDLAKNDDERKWFTVEGPQHSVTISQGYWLFDTPVTQALWEAVMGDNPSEYKSPRRPVETVSWDEANVFITQLNDKIQGLKLSLPTEAQWEYACRANTATSTYNGELEIVGECNGPLLDEIAWYTGNSGVNFDLDEGYDSSDWPEKQYDHVKAGTQKVVLKRSNGWGLYDMLGNVWEWCRDGQRSYEDKAEVDPVGPMEHGASRVVRGGAWYNGARSLRAASRDALGPGDRDYDLGLRCARVQDQETGRAELNSRLGSGRSADRTAARRS